MIGSMGGGMGSIGSDRIHGEGLQGQRTTDPNHPIEPTKPAKNNVISRERKRRGSLQPPQKRLIKFSFFRFPYKKEKKKNENPPPTDYIPEWMSKPN